MEDNTQMEEKREVSALPLVSVIMPCYNDGAYIEEAVASLQKQTYPNIELIIIDDGSDDVKTRDALKRLQHPGLQILHTKHVRPAAARNTGIRAAKGQYILPLDSDDTIEPEYIEKAVQVLEKDRNVGIVYCHADLFGEEKGAWALPDYELRLELLDNCIFVTALFRKDDWSKVGGFAEDFLHGMEDYDFWLSILGLGREVVQLPEVYFHYRIKAVSRTTGFNSNLKAVQETYLRLYERHKELYQQHMDIYCTEMRRALIEATVSLRHHEANASSVAVEDPVIAYWRSVKLFKPRLAKVVTRMLTLKDSVKRMIGRK